MAAVSAGALLLALPARTPAASAPAGQTGTQLLQAQLPPDTAVMQATREQLTHAVAAATRTHRADAESILAAALTRSARKGALTPEAKLPCAWVASLLHTAVVTAPEKASNLMELASSLYPDCADSLQKAVELFNDKNVADGKTVVDDKNGPAAPATSPAAASPADNNGSTDPGDLNLSDPQVRDISLVDGGYSPGFPGTPGFVGSATGGGIALPSPVAPSVTPVAND